MNIKSIRWVIVVAAFAFAGIIISQVFWIRKGLLINQSNFEKAIIVSLDNVASRIEIQNWGIRKTSNPVVRISPRSYLVDISEKIDVNFLDEELHNNFSNPYHDIDYSYEIYNKINNKKIYSDTVFMESGKYEVDEELQNLPVFDKGTYYFKVNFPKKPVVSSIMISVWVIAIIILLAILFFFWYSLNVIMKQHRLTEFQKNFINNLAHELKTPISTISISAEVINEDDIINEPLRLKDYATIIRNENNRLKNQVTKILELAKLESDEVMLSKEHFHLEDELNQILDSFRIKVEEMDGELIQNFETTDIKLNGDTTHFINMINTLLDNALKYSGPSPIVELITREDAKHIYISVKDNGIGIQKEYHTKIFEKFFRVPTGNVHNVKGFGLGLNYVKMILNAHKWHLEIQSELKKGSIFTIVVLKQE